MNSYPLFKIFTDGKDKGTYKGALELDTMRDYVLGAAHFYNPIKCVCWGVYNMQGHVQGCLGVRYDAGLHTRGCPVLQPNQVRVCVWVYTVCKYAWPLSAASRKKGANSGG